MSGHGFVCGLSTEQTVHCWAEFLQPYLVEIRGFYTQISAGRGFLCGILVDGRISCSGYTQSAVSYPQEHSEKFVQISCSFDVCCALDASGHVICWGGPRDPHVITPPKLHETIGPEGESSTVCCL